MKLAKFRPQNHPASHKKAQKSTASSDSLTQFADRLNSLLKGVDRDELTKKTQAFVDRKVQFHEEVAKIAKEYF